MQNYLINCGDRSQAFLTTRLQVEVTNNTIYNIYQPNIMIRAYVLAGLTVTKNVGYYTGVTAKNYLTGVYDTAGFTADKAEVTYNYLYTAPVSDTNFCRRSIPEATRLQTTRWATAWKLRSLRWMRRRGISRSTLRW